MTALSLARPFTLGVTNAATLGAASAIVFDLSIPGLAAMHIVPLFAFAAALGATLLVNFLARSQGAGADTVVLFGIAMVFVMNALLWLVQYVASADAVQQIVFWTMGSLTRSSWDKAAIIAAALALCLPLSLRQVWAMTTLRGGEDHARSFGIQVERLRLVVLVRVSLLAAVAVSFVGTIGFIGLVGPHLARLTLGEDHRFYLPGAALAGALVMSLASTASKAIVPGLVLPVGIVTAVVGIPLFMALLLGGVAHLARHQRAIALIAIHDINLAARFCTRLVILGQALSPDILHRAYGIHGRVESCSLGFPMVLADSAAERSFP